MPVQCAKDVGQACAGRQSDRRRREPRRRVHHFGQTDRPACLPQVRQIHR